MSNKAKIREDAMSLNPIDDALFMKMAEDIRFCQEILQVILNDDGLKVLNNTPQFTAKNMQGRSCILDLKCQLGDGRLVDVEVQKANDDNHQKRVLYNTALMITNTVDPKDKFEQVPDVIAVFISAFDMFNQGKTMYHIDRVIRETGAVISNGMEEVYVNAAVDDKSDVAELMKVFTEDNIYNDVKFPITSEIKRRFKTTEEGVSEMCEVIERNRAEAAIEATIEEKKKNVIGMIKEGLGLDLISRVTSLTVEQITAIGKQAALL